MGEWKEIINSITNIITTFATLGMLGVAGFALHVWRKEFIGKKKIELASEIMLCAYDIQDLIINARLPMFSELENQGISAWMENEKLRDPKNTIVCPMKFQYLAPQYRLNQSNDKIECFFGLYNKAFMYWGENIMKLLNELHSFIYKIRSASMELYYSEKPELHPDLINVIWHNGKDDEMSKRINDIVDEIKLNLEPIYKDKRMQWKKLKKARGNGNE